VVVEASGAVERGVGLTRKGPGLESRVLGGAWLRLGLGRGGLVGAWCVLSRSSADTLSMSGPRRLSRREERSLSSEEWFLGACRGLRVAWRRIGLGVVGWEVELVSVSIPEVVVVVFGLGEESRARRLPREDSAWGGLGGEVGGEKCLGRHLALDLC
jgi:hypothetical protein